MKFIFSFLFALLLISTMAQLPPNGPPKKQGLLAGAGGRFPSIQERLAYHRDSPGTCIGTCYWVHPALMVQSLPGSRATRNTFPTMGNFIKRSTRAGKKIKVKIIATLSSGSVVLKKSFDIAVAYQEQEF